METDVNQKLPAVRGVDVAPFKDDEGEWLFAVQDPSQIAPHALALTLPGYFVLTQLDGESTCRDVQMAFLQQFGQMLPAEQVEQMVAALDESLLLHTDRFENEYRARQLAYARGETRDNRDRYPGETELRVALEEIVEEGQAAETNDLRGLIAPHLDYGRGRPCYADAYATLAQAPPADRYVILGTNHFGRSASVVATRKDFQTPLGCAITDRALIDRLESLLGQPLCEHEFDHAAEHSVELQLHMLQVIQSEHPFAIVPILCPDPCGPTGTQPCDGRGPDLGDFADALADLLARDDRRTVVIAGADLSHVGQRFGDEAPTTEEFLQSVRQSDAYLLKLLEQRDEQRFVDTLAKRENPTRVCSAGCIYAALRALPEQPLRVLRYHQAISMEAETHVTCVAAVIGN